MIDFIIALVVLFFVAAVAYYLGKREGARTTTMPKDSNHRDGKSSTMNKW